MARAQPQAPGREGCLQERTRGIVATPNELEPVNANGNATLAGMGPVPLPFYTQCVVFEPLAADPWSISNALFVE